MTQQSPRTWITTTIASFTPWTAQTSTLGFLSVIFMIVTPRYYSFFTEAERIGSPNYVPNEKDILRCRQKATSGIVEMVFQGPPLPYTPPQPVLCATSASPPRKDSPAPLRMRMIEVELGGHHSELKKWLNHFEGVTSIVFCTALSDYDQASPEQPGQVRRMCVLGTSCSDSHYSLYRIVWRNPSGCLNQS